MVFQYLQELKGLTTSFRLVRFKVFTLSLRIYWRVRLGSKMDLSQRSPTYLITVTSLTIVTLLCLTIVEMLLVLAVDLRIVGLSAPQIRQLLKELQSLHQDRVNLKQ